MAEQVLRMTKTGEIVLSNAERAIERWYELRYQTAAYEALVLCRKFYPWRLIKNKESR